MIWNCLERVMFASYVDFSSPGNVCCEARSIGAVSAERKAEVEDAPRCDGECGDQQRRARHRQHQEELVQVARRSEQDARDDWRWWRHDCVINDRDQPAAPLALHLCAPAGSGRSEALEQSATGCQEGPHHARTNSAGTDDVRASVRHQLENSAQGTIGEI